MRHRIDPGIVFAGAAYTAWGLFPLYFSLLRRVPAIEVLLSRMVWALVAVAIVMLCLRRWSWIGPAIRTPRLLARYAVAALLVSVNWLVFIWATQNGHVVDASLGYFITPLVNVVLGRVVLGERPRPLQWAAIGVATVGVLWLGVRAGHVPWIGLALAMTFGAYGLAKKTAPLGALEGLAVETGLLFPFALAALLWLGAHDRSTFMTAGPGLRCLLVASGPLTALPLLCFAAGARRVSMTTLGLVQYISPTLQLLGGVVVLGEPFGRASLVGYLLVWTALAVYAGESLWRAGRSTVPQAVAPRERPGAGGHHEKRPGTA